MVATGILHLWNRNENRSNAKSTVSFYTMFTSTMQYFMRYNTAKHVNKHYRSDIGRCVDVALISGRVETVRLFERIVCVDNRIDGTMYDFLSLIPNRCLGAL